MKSEAISRREWIPLETYLNETVSIYERSWSVTGAIGWVWRKLWESVSGEDDSLPIGRFVIRSNLEVRTFGRGLTCRKQLPRY